MVYNIRYVAVFRLYIILVLPFRLGIKIRILSNRVYNASVQTHIRRYIEYEYFTVLLGWYLFLNDVELAMARLRCGSFSEDA